jgi:large subunit ribosomal protein L21
MVSLSQEKKDLPYAIVETGGKQVRVVPGDLVWVERIKKSPGEVVYLDRVLLLSRNGKVDIGRPYLEGVRVVAEVVEERKGEKIFVFHKRRRKRYKKAQGHRSIYTCLRIQTIEGGSYGT